MSLKTAANAIRASSLHITMSPPVRSLNQSQRVLEALQKFGEVTTFLNTKYNATNIKSAKSRCAGNSAIVIFENDLAATAAKAASPLSVPINSSGMMSHSGEESATTIKVAIEESSHMHEETILHNPFYAHFPVNTDSIEVQDLIRSSSNYHSAPTPSFADCFTAWKRSVPLRILKTVERYNARRGATSLMDMWKTGQEKRGESSDIEPGNPTNSSDLGVQGSGGIFQRRSAAGRVEEERARLKTLGSIVPSNRQGFEGTWKGE